MGIQENKAVVKRLFDEVWNGRRFDVIDELYAADYVADYRRMRRFDQDAMPYAKWSSGHGRRRRTTTRNSSP